MKFRKALGKDAVGIATVLKECYNIDSIKEGIAVFKAESHKGHHYIAADDEGRIAGLTTWKMHGLPKHGLCELDRIAVLSDYRGKGVAQALFNSLIKAANEKYGEQGFKLRKLYILTHDNNKIAQAFYKKIGMNHETTLKDHYYNGKEEFVFSKFF